MCQYANGTMCQLAGAFNGLIMFIFSNWHIGILPNWHIIPSFQSVFKLLETNRNQYYRHKCQNNNLFHYKCDIHSLDHQLTHSLNVPTGRQYIGYHLQYERHAFYGENHTGKYHGRHHQNQSRSQHGSYLPQAHATHKPTTTGS